MKCTHEPSYNMLLFNMISDNVVNTMDSKFNFSLELSCPLQQNLMTLFHMSVVFKDRKGLMIMDGFHALSFYCRTS